MSTSQDKRLMEMSESSLQRRVRLARLRFATGVAYPTGYRVFRWLVLALAACFDHVTVIGGENLPGGIKYYPPWYRRSGTTAISKQGYIIAGTHRTVHDIVGMGQVSRPMIWLCKAGFSYYINLLMGAVPIFRFGIDNDLDKYSPRQIRRNYRRSFHGMPEYSHVIIGALDRNVPLGIFPEGARDSEKLTVSDAKRGLAIFANASRKVIYPLSTVGAGRKDPHVYRMILTGRVWPHNQAPGKLRRIVYRRWLFVMIGTPVEQFGLDKITPYGEDLDRTVAAWGDACNELAELGRQKLREAKFPKRTNS